MAAAVVVEGAQMKMVVVVVVLSKGGTVEGTLKMLVGSWEAENPMTRDVFHPATSSLELLPQELSPRRAAARQMASWRWRRKLESLR
ncbi:hypothetical protein EMCG_07788 [[Emmonsia] crescens]|uniref:Uncharacterized protein n=1 Tax=[Emmonsia] crescens TaxID=73230 RepID=A0A0G2I8C1_9EURO|nr:hypothetical protein EMCG_07788 [Emmonsia crescens UAMH 3008]